MKYPSVNTFNKNFMQKISAVLLFIMMLSLFVGCKTIPSYNDVIPVHDSLSIVSVKLNDKDYPILCIELHR